MKRLTRTLPLILAAALQLLPVLRNLVTNPAASSSFAFILRWGIGAGAVIGSVDAVSGATSAFTSPSTFSGAVGTYFTNNVSVTIGGGNTASSSDYFLLSAGTAISPLLGNGQTTTVTMPSGLTFMPFWVNNSSVMSGAIYGTPTVPGSFPITITCGSPGNAAVSTTITITISGSVAPTAPAITGQPAAATIIAGKTAAFTVVASGTAPLGYFWSKNGTLVANTGNISGANTATLTVSNVAAVDAGNYSVLVSNAVGTVTSTSAALAVILPPAITSPPAPQTQSAGSTAQFAVTAGGTAPLNYFWLKNGAGLANGTKYSGVNSNVLTIAAVATTDAGNYSVTVTNLAGSITSSAAALTIVTSPTIVTPPANQAVVAGAGASFTVAAAGSTPLVYRWLKNGTPLADGGNIAGAGTTNLNLSTVSTNDAASYSVTVSNNLGSITSAAATLTVSVPPAIVTSPANATVLAGSNVSFTASASGSATLIYQWRKNGINLANGGNVSGATTTTLTLANVAATDAANYSLLVSNAVGSATSSSATLTVLVPPAITAPPANVTVTQGNPASFAVTASGTAPLNFQWLKNGGVIIGANSNVFALSAVTTNDVAVYSVVITNLAGSVASAGAALTVLVPPAIVTSPTDITAIAGSNVSFTVTASGTAPLTYQWRKNGGNLVNGGNISGATAATLMLANVSATDAASYSVVVANAAGSATSASAVLTVQLPPAIVTPPASQFGALGSTINLAVTASGTGPLSYQWFNGSGALTDSGNITGATSNHLTITALTANEVATYFVVVSNFLGSVTSASASVAVNVAPIITGQPASQIAAVSNTVVLTVTASGTGPLAYQWRKNGTSLANGGTVSGATSPALSFASVTTNNNGNYSVVITNIYGSITSSVATLAVLNPPKITSQPTNRVVKTGTNITLVVTATGTGPLNYQWLKDGSPLVDGGNISGSLSNVLTVSALSVNDAGSYAVFITNAVGSATSAGATLTVLVPPAITAQPVSQAIVASNAVTFSVAATGTAPLRYQWRKGAVIIANATNWNYTIASVKTNDAAIYSVAVTNLAGSVTSSNAALTVLVTPSFILQATNRFAKLGTTTIFRAAVTGTAPFGFQWLKDGVALADGGNISGSLSNVLTVANLTTSDVGGYALTASNSAGTATSSNALLTVLVPPVITVPPASQSVALSNAVSFSVTATGTAPLRYQWRKAAAAIAGATNFSFTLTSVKTNDAAAYSVVVTNLAGSVTSAVATLTVWVPPAFTLQATNRTATNGTTTLFRAAVTGTAPFSYQWFKNGAALTDGGNISGSLSNVLTVASLTTNDAAAYSLAVTNFAGGLTSSNATLTVLTPASSGGGGDGGDGGTDRVIISGKPGSHRSNAQIVNLAAAKTHLSAIIAPPIQPVISQLTKNPDGSITVTATGAAGADYVLQATSDFIIWNRLSTNTADASGRCQMTDTNAATRPSGFYRLATP